MLTQQKLISKSTLMEDIEWIKWNEQEYCWVDNLGNCYMSVIDIPEDLNISWVVNPSLVEYYKLKTNFPCQIFI
jgi:hypothetical protein